MTPTKPMTPPQPATRQPSRSNCDCRRVVPANAGTVKATGRNLMGCGCLVSVGMGMLAATEIDTLGWLPKATLAVALLAWTAAFAGLLLEAQHAVSRTTARRD